MREHVPSQEQKTPQSETLGQLLPGVVPGSVLTIHTGKTDYSIRVDNCAPSGDEHLRHIGGTVIDAMGKIMPGASIHFFCPIAGTGQALRLLLPGNNTLDTSAVRGFSLERAAIDVGAYRGERWKHRFETEPADPKRGMRTLISLIPEEVGYLEKRVVHLEEPGAYRGQSREEYDRQETQRHEWAEGARQQAAWLRSAHEFLQRMLVDDRIIPWQTVIAQMPEWKPEHVRYMMELLIEIIKPRIITNTREAQDHMAIADTPNEALAQKALGLRDARGVLGEIRKTFSVDKK